MYNENFHLVIESDYNDDRKGRKGCLCLAHCPIIAIFP